MWNLFVTNVGKRKKTQSPRRGFDMFEPQTPDHLSDALPLSYRELVATEIGHILGSNGMIVNSPYIFNTVSSRQVMRMKKIINWGMWSWYNTKFSGLADREMYGFT